MILVWLPLFIVFLLCASLLIPRETVQRYKDAPRDWQYWTAHALFYSIPASSFFTDDDSSSVMFSCGMLAFASGGALYIWAVRSNPYFSPEITMPPSVVTTGAYKWMEHPGYAALAMMVTGTWLMVGAEWAAIPLVLYVGLLLYRRWRESLLLSAAGSS